MGQRFLSPPHFYATVLLGGTQQGRQRRQWHGLELFLSDGRVEADNNLVENAIRPTAIGKKNWLFMGEAGAGQRGTIIYTLIGSCRKRSIDPYAYLRDLLTRLPTLKNTQIKEITPAAWAKALQKPTTAKS